MITVDPIYKLKKVNVIISVHLCTSFIKKNLEIGVYHINCDIGNVSDWESALFHSQESCPQKKIHFFTFVNLV